LCLSWFNLVRIEYPTKFFCTRRFQHTLGFRATVYRSIGGGAVVLDALCGALAKFVKVDDVAHRLQSPSDASASSITTAAKLRVAEQARSKAKVFLAAAQYTLR
jgi:hypothetical protein